MKKYFLPFLFYIIASLSNYTGAEEIQIQVINEDKKYRILNVDCKIKNYEDIYETKNQCLNNARDIAFLHLMQYLNENINSSTKNIDKTLESFELIQENFLPSEYSVTYNFVFDKQAIEQLKNKSKNVVNFDGNDNIILKIYYSKSQLLNNIFMKIYKIHKEVRYNSLNKEYLEILIKKASVEEFKKFLDINFIKYNHFDFLKQDKSKDIVIEVF